jgi:hypothetical protein
VAQRESRSLVRLATSVSQRVLTSEHRFVAGLQVSDLFAPALAAARKALGDSATLACESALPTCTADRHMLTRLGLILVQLVLWADPHASCLRLTAAGIALPSGRPAIRISVIGGPSPWTADQHARLYQALAVGDPVLHDEADLLAAHLIVHHHSGSLAVHACAPEGPGISVVLPLDPTAEVDEPIPETWIDDVLTFQHDA